MKLKDAQYDKKIIYLLISLSKVLYHGQKMRLKGEDTINFSLYLATGSNKCLRSKLLMNKSNPFFIP